MKILKKITTALEASLPFVVYNKPNEDKVFGFFQVDTKLHTANDFNESGFIFAPFDDKKTTVLIPYAFSETYQEVLNFDEKYILDSDFSSDNSSEKNHIALIKKGIEAIEKHQFKKVVLSRKEIVEKDDADIIQLFQKLLQTYQSAFVYVWFHPKVGLWLGATPETLVKIKGNAFTTMSLAGTQIYKGDMDVVWEPKEINEQQLVTDYVLEKLKPVCKFVAASKVVTIKAGNLLHLKTEISGEFIHNDFSLIAILHPTPAVCGFPKEASKDFILKNENYDRRFYTGFLGELNLPNSELYVNLRCMEVNVADSEVHVYVGGGITRDSIPEKEWEETVMKTKTMKKVLN